LVSGFGLKSSSLADASSGARDNDAKPRKPDAEKDKKDRLEPASQSFSAPASDVSFEAFSTLVTKAEVHSFVTKRAVARKEKCRIEIMEIVCRVEDADTDDNV